MITADPLPPTKQSNCTELCARLRVLFGYIRDRRTNDQAALRNDGNGSARSDY